MRTITRYLSGDFPCRPTLKETGRGAEEGDGVNLQRLIVGIGFLQVSDDLKLPISIQTGMHLGLIRGQNATKAAISSPYLHTAMSRGNFMSKTGSLSLLQCVSGALQVRCGVVGAAFQDQYAAFCWPWQGRRIPTVDLLPPAQCLLGLRFRCFL